MPDTNMLPAATGHSDLLESPAQFEHMQRVAKVFCASALIPQHLRGNNGADALLALAIAKRMGEDPVMVLQNIYVVHGRAGWSAQYMIARANRSGTFKGPISWREEGKGDAYAVTAFAKVAATGEEVSFTVSMATAKAEGWTANKKYQTLGPLMLRYRSATLLIRLYCPEVMMGMPGVDEIEDTAAAAVMRDVTPAAAVTAALLADPTPEPAHDAATGEIIDTESAESNGEPSHADASEGAAPTSHPEPQPSEAVIADPEPQAEPWTEDEVKSAVKFMCGQIDKLRTPKAIDNYIATSGQNLVEIKRASNAAYQHVMDKAVSRKNILAASV